MNLTQTLVAVFVVLLLGGSALLGWARDRATFLLRRGGAR